MHKVKLKFLVVNFLNSEQLFINPIVVPKSHAISHEYFLSAIAEPPLMLLHPTPSDVLVRYGNESVELRCLAITFAENVTYSWEKENSTIPSKVVGQDSHILTIPQVRLADTGNYRCLATDQNGVAKSHFAYVNVSGKDLFM